MRHAPPRRPQRAYSLWVSLALAALVIALHGIALFQGPTWSSPLVLGDHLFDLLLAACMFWLALALGGPILCHLSSPADDALTARLSALALGMGTVSIGVLLLGFLRLYYTPIFCLGAVGTAVVLRHSLVAIWREVGRALGDWHRRGMPTAPTLAQRAVLIILLLTSVTVVIRAWTPVTGYLVDWDALAYHLSAPKMYLHAHQFMPLPAIQLANAPSGEEMLFLVGLAFGTDTLGKSLDLCFALALAVALYAAGRRLFDVRAAWLGILLLFSTFWLVIILPMVLTDVASTFFLVLGVTDALVWLTCSLDAPPVDIAHALRQPWRDHKLLLRAGILLGLSVSFKLTNLPVLPAIVLVMLLAPCYGATARRRLVLVQVLIGVCIIGAAALITMSPWLLKNLDFFGNPLYPQNIAAAATTAVAPPPAGTPSLAPAAPSELQVRLITPIEGVVHFFWSYMGQASVLLLLAPLLLRDNTARTVQAFVVIGGILWLSYVPFDTPRYYLAVGAFGALLIGATLYGLIDRLSLSRAIPEALIGLYLGAAALWALGTGVYLMERHSGVSAALGTLSRDAYLSAEVRPYQAEAWVNRHTPTGATIAMVGETRGFYLDRHYLEDWYQTRLSRLEGTISAQRAELGTWCTAGVRYAIFNRGNDQDDDDSQAAIQPRSAFTWLKVPGLQPQVLFSAHGVDVLALNPCDTQHS